MEETFPPALVERINASAGAGRHRRSRERRRRAHGRAVPLPRHRRSHLARHSLLSRVSQERRAGGHDGHQQPVLVERGRQVLQLRAGRRGSASPIPPTVLLPHKQHPPGTTDRSMRNLQYPIDWDAVFEYVGFPAFLKPFDGGGWKDVYKVESPQEFFAAYDQTRRPVHDAAARPSISASTSAATSSVRSTCASCRTIRARRFHERYVQDSAGVRPGAARPGRTRCDRRSAARSATT